MAAPNPQVRVAPSGPVAGGFKSITKIQETIADTLIAANNTGSIVLNVPGAVEGDTAFVNLGASTPALPNGLIYAANFVAADQVILVFSNPTAGGIQTGALVLDVTLIKFS